jgi:hypothetical protein
MGDVQRALAVEHLPVQYPPVSTDVVPAPIVDKPPALTWKGIKRKADKVALAGFASTSRGQAPYGDPTFEIWVLNDLFRQVPKWDRMFEVHPREYLLRNTWKRPNGIVEGDEYWKHLCSLPGPNAGDKFSPVYALTDYTPEMPASVAYPFDEVTAAYSTPHGEESYMTCTPALMLGLALLEGFQEIHLYGIDLVSDGSEYLYERPCMEYYIGLGRGMGRKIVIPKQSALCKSSYTYGRSFPVEKGTYGPLLSVIKTQTEKLEGELRRHEVGVGATQTALQIVQVIDKWVEDNHLTAADKEALVKAWIAYSVEQKQKLGKQWEDTKAAFNFANGTIAGLRAVETWGGHIERGGVVNP